MNTFFNQELARHHQETLLREANNTRLAQRLRTQSQVVTSPKVIIQPKTLSEADFDAIRRDLRSALSEWYLDTGSTNSDNAIDTFMQHLRKRLGGSGVKVKSATH